MCFQILTAKKCGDRCDLSTIPYNAIGFYSFSSPLPSPRIQLCISLFPFRTMLLSHEHADRLLPAAIYERPSSSSSSSSAAAAHADPSTEERNCLRHDPILPFPYNPPGRDSPTCCLELGMSKAAKGKVRAKMWTGLTTAGESRCLPFSLAA